MAFYKTRSVTYDTSKYIGRFNAALGPATANSLRRGLYSGGKLLGDVNALTGGGGRAGGAALSGRVLSRLSGSALQRFGRGPFTSQILQRGFAEVSGSTAMAAQGASFRTKVQVRENKKYWTQDIVQDPVHDGPLMASANSVAARIRLLAPKESGTYAASVSTAIVNTKDGRRAAAIFVADPKWKFLEYGTRFMPAQKIIRRSLPASGGKIVG